MAPPRKYHSAEERRAARLIWRRNDRDRKRRGEPTRLKWAGHEQGIESIDPRPPIEVLLERDHRSELTGYQSQVDVFTSVPPATYAAAYYVKAWRMQRKFAREA